MCLYGRFYTNLSSVSRETGATVLTGEFTNGNMPLIVVSPDRMDSFALTTKSYVTNAM